MLNFGNVDTEIPLPNFAAESCVPCARVWSAQKKKKKKGNCGNAIVEIRKKKRKYFFGNCGNGIAENWEKN